MRKFSLKLVSAFFILGMLMAQPLDCAEAETANIIKLYLGEIKTICVSRPTRIVISNPDIVDVARVSKEEMTLKPKAAGTTLITLWDDFGEQAMTVKVFSENITPIKKRIDSLLGKLDLPSIQTQAEEEEGKVLLLGSVKTAQDRERIATVLGPLKDKTVDLIKVKEEETVVEIDVQILELDQGATTTLGFTWPGSINLVEVGSPGLNPIGTNFGSVFRLGNVVRASTTGVITPYMLKLDALIQEGKARVLSRPRLSCQSGKEAELLVGGEKPILTTTVSGVGAGTGTQVEYKEYGIKLKIKPIVTEGNRVKLSLNVEVSDFDETAVTLGSTGVGTSSTTALAYPLVKRQASTELYLDDGETMAIGGLIKQKSEEALRKVPWLADIPVLGAFFRQRITKTGSGQESRQDTELFIALTPRVVGAVVEPKQNKNLPSVSAPQEDFFSETANLAPGLANYTRIVQQRILENLVYPAPAKSAGFQGTVKIKLVLSYQGEVLNAAIKESSGYSVLDENAVAVVYQLAPYPPFPPSIDSEELQIDIPIVYKLN